MQLGVIAEDRSDVEVLKKILKKVLPKKAVGVKHFVGSGCGKLRRKCRAWTEDLVARGCTHIVVAHDLDDEDETELRKRLQDSIKDLGCPRALILIPVREIEAWLLTDAEALKKVFSLSTVPRLPGNPESVRDPKEALEALVWKLGKKRYVNSVHNELIADAADLASFGRCRSFRPYPAFLQAKPTKA